MHWLVTDDYMSNIIEYDRVQSKSRATDYNNTLIILYSHFCQVFKSIQ